MRFGSRVVYIGGPSEVSVRDNASSRPTAVISVATKCTLTRDVLNTPRCFSARLAGGTAGRKRDCQPLPSHRSRRRPGMTVFLGTAVVHRVVLEEIGCRILSPPLHDAKCIDDRACPRIVEGTNMTYAIIGEGANGRDARSAAIIGEGLTGATLARLSPPRTFPSSSPTRAAPKRSTNSPQGSGRASRLVGFPSFTAEQEGLQRVATSQGLRVAEALDYAEKRAKKSPPQR